MVLNLVVAALKIMVGLATHSLAMVADGFHSTLDASSNVIGLIGNAIAARPPDDSHPYGHERFETIAALSIGALLLVAAFEITRSVIERIAQGGAPQVTAMSFVVMVITLGINGIALFYERRAGRALNSELLLADASHTASDVYVSLSVIASLVAVRLGLQWFDVAVAIGIVVLIGLTAFKIIRRTADVLVDGTATNPAPIRKVASSVAGVNRVTGVRSRGPQGAIHVDVDVDVDAAMTADRTHAIASEIKQQVTAHIEGIHEVEVHFAPYLDGEPDFGLVSRAVADAMGVSVHEVSPIQASSGIVLDLHLEMPGGLTLEEAHAQATTFEERVQARLPEVVDVVTHLEPASTGERTTARDRSAQDIHDRALACAYELFPDANWHDVRVVQDGDDYALALHCHLPGEVTLEEAHAIAEQVETRIRSKLPQVTRVTIHTEPPE